MKKQIGTLILVATLLNTSCSCMLAETLNTEAEEIVKPPKYKSVSVHDPSIIRTEDGTFYIYGSHMAAAKSEDLISWTSISKDAQAGCTLVEDVQQQMKEALSWAKTNTFWAPDVQQLPDGRYAMYYCTCEGSSPLSALGLAIAEGPEGPFQDQGVFLKSGMSGYNANYYPNVVDPCAFFDQEGRMWMVYGSYSGGIFILEMDPKTGFPLEGQNYGTKLLGQNHARIEAPYILYSPETGYYYLFLSFGGLDSNGGYNIRVCRSRKPDGPYTDSLGQEMIRCGGASGTFFHDVDYEPYGVKLMGGYKFAPAESDTNNMVQAFRSPGHCSAYYEEETGRYFLVFHTRFANSGESFSVRVHQMFMNENGWPVVSPLRYTGEGREAPLPENRPGMYKILFHEHDINTVEHVSKTAAFHENGTVSGDCEGTWTCTEKDGITLVLGTETYTGVFTRALDGAQSAWVSCFTALNEKGEAVWGIRTDPCPNQ
ncbi:MAG: glycoside hydrolase family 43 protein [Clostridiales bacterium]|nr:glycoside hydrolase family 43 protein [Clostridiales bacterium]